MKNLPIGIQTFAKIRDKKGNYVYIDKADLSVFHFIEKLKYR